MQKNLQGFNPADQLRFIIALYSCLLLITPFCSQAQTNAEKGLPFITNYSPKTYNALPQTWSVLEDERGIKYFGIQNYLLEYDGVSWRKVMIAGNARLPVVRTMTKSKEGVIYYGAYGDLGYIYKDSLGQTKTKSLLEFIPAPYRNFLDVWSTHVTEKGIYFQSHEYIFRLSEKTSSNNERTVKVWKPRTNFMYTFYLDGTYYVHQQGLGLFKMIDDSLLLIPGSEFLGKERVQVMLPYDNGPNGEKQYLVGMFYGGLYLFNGKTFQQFKTEADQVFKSGNLLYKGLKLQNGNYVLGTTGKGVMVIDSHGKLLQKINRDVGLQDESVYGLFEDKKGTLWLAMDNGISRVETSSPLTKFTLQSGINTGVLYIKRFQGNLFVGTTNGLLKFNSSNSFFEPVSGIPQNQVFTLLPDGNQLLVPGDGLFAIKDNRTFTIRESVSADMTLSGLYISNKYPNILIGGGSFGAAIFTRNGAVIPGKATDNWHFVGYVPGITDQIWTITENKDGTFWAGTQNGAAYLITLAFDEKGNPDLKKIRFEKYGAEQGYKNGLGQVYSIKGVTYFIADSSMYKFDVTKKSFVADSTFGTFKNGGGLTEFDMFEDHQGRVWIRFGKQTRLAIPKPGGGYTIDDTQLSSISELTIQKFYEEENDIVWACTTDGLIRYDENLEKNNDQSFKSILRHVAAGKTSLSTVTGDNMKRSSISFNDNTLRFEYAAPFFEQEDKTRYQTWLEGFEKDWSDLGNNYYKEYTNIPSGKYTFHVRAQNIYQKLSDEAVYSFEILPPWYRTWLAYFLYAVAAIGSIYLIIRRRTQHLHEKHRELEKVVAERTHEISQRVEELAVINSVQEGLVREMDMQGIYELVGEKIREIFNAQVIDIVTYDKDKNLIEDKYSYEKGDRTLIGSWKPIGFGKHVIETGKSIVINEDLVKKSIEFNSKAIYGENAKSAVWVPLITGNEVKGIISLQNMDKEHAFTDSDVNLLTTLANSMSMALESARRFHETNRLLKETEQRTAELSVINSVQDGLAKELDIQGIYELVGEKVREIFNAQVIDIVTYDAKLNLIEDRYAYEKGDTTLLGAREPKGLRKNIIETGQPFVINHDYEKISLQYDNTILIGEQPKSVVLVPLISGGKVSGMISLQNLDHENVFTDADVNLLTTLANSMSVALENARLFDETSRLLKETEQRTAELAVINSVQEGLAKELDIQAIYDLVGDKLAEVMNTLDIDIRLFSPETNQVFYPYVRDRGVLIQVPPSPIKGMSKYILETCQNLIINEKLAERMAEMGSTLVPGTQMEKSFMAVPIMAGNIAMGMVSVSNYEKENAFNNSDVRLLQTVVSAMTVALKNAKLFDETNRLLKETEQRTAELAVINSVQEGLAKELDMQGIYDLVGDRIQKLFQTHAVIIATFDLVNRIEHFNYVFENGKKYKLESRSFNKLREKLIDKKQTIYIETGDVARTQYGITAIGDTKMPRSLMFVPLLSGNNIKGYVSIQNIDKENAFNETDIRLLETLANSMSVALENARLFDETNRLLKETEMRQEELATINSVQEGLVKEFKSAAIYELVGGKLCELFDTESVLIRSFDHANGKEIWQYAIEKGERQYTEPRPFNWANKKLIKTLQPIFINENYVETARQFGGSGVSVGKPPKSAVFVPMIVGDMVRGSVSLQNLDKENAFDEADVKLLTTITNSMGVALENARLFDETTRLLDEAKQRATELSTVNSISKALASQLDADNLIQLVGDQLKDLFNANIVYLALLNSKTRMINFAYQYGEVMPPRILGAGLTSKIILTGEPLLLNKDVDEKTEQLGVQRIGLPAASYLGVPIPVGDENIGVLSVQSTEKENRFNENDLRLLSTIASSVGVALRNATLFEEVKLAKMEAETASKLAEKANEAKSAFLSTVSHELRTPLTSVLGFAKIIRKRLEEKIFPIVDKTDAKTGKTISQVSENLQVVISEGERLTHLINDVLDLAKIEAGKMDWNRENVSMAEVAERAIAATTSLFDQKSLQLIRQIEPDLPEIIGDRDKLIQVVINLISNSVKFTDRGSITCRLQKKGNEIVVSIIDTGIGIKAEDFGAVFEQFKQVGGDTLTDKPKGTGLGLPICKEIVEHLGGRIWLESEVGIGSTFSFALPIVKPEDAKTKPLHLNELVKQLKEQMVFSKLKIEGKNSTILIVDDDDSIRSLLRQELSEAGYLTEEAANGKEALECIRKSKPDLVILDVMMPEINGFDVAAILKNDPQTMDIPIIVLSIVQDKARGFRIGVDRYLTKPIDTTQLFAEVGTLLEQGKSKKKVMVVDEDTVAVRTLTDVLQAKGYHVVESDGKELVANAIAAQPDIIILNSILTDKSEIVQTLRFEKGLENVLFFIYQ